MTTDALLQIDDLRLGLRTGNGVVHALRGVSLDVRSGEVLAVVGESGCGKSVTMQALLGLFAPGQIAYRTGLVLFAGQDLLRLSEPDLRRVRGAEIGMVFQDPMVALTPTLTIGEQIGEALLAHRKVPSRDARRRVITLLEQVGVPHPEIRARQYPFQLSGGLRQRALIAAALAGGPKVLIADEPTTALDVTIQAQILALLRALQRTTDLAVILVTHDLGVVAEIAHRVAVMYAGRIVEEGTVEQILTRPAHPYTWGLLDCLPKLAGDRGRLRSIEGQPPHLMREIAGCAFAVRCPHAMEVCGPYAPPLFTAEDGHRSACWLLHPSAEPVARRTCLMAGRPG